MGMGTQPLARKSLLQRKKRRWISNVPKARLHERQQDAPSAGPEQGQLSRVHAGTQHRLTAQAPGTCSGSLRGAACGGGAHERR